MCIGLSFVNVPLALGLGVSLLLLVLVIPTVFYQLGKKFGDKLVHSRATLSHTILRILSKLKQKLLLFNAEDKLKNNMAKTEANWQADQQKEANLSGFSTALFTLLKWFDYCRHVVV